MSKLMSILSQDSVTLTVNRFRNEKHGKDEHGKNEKMERRKATLIAEVTKPRGIDDIEIVEREQNQIKYIETCT